MNVKRESTHLHGRITNPAIPDFHVTHVILSPRLKEACKHKAIAIQCDVTALVI
jgi:hypothetical protein